MLTLPKDISDFLSANVAPQEYKTLWQDSDVLKKPEALKLKKKVESEVADRPEKLFNLLLQVAAKHHTNTSNGIDKINFTATIPGGNTLNLSSSIYAVSELLRTAQSEVIMLCYRITNERIMDAIQECSSRRVKVSIVCDRKEGDANVIQNRWPSDCPKPNLYQDALRPDSVYNDKMHSKLMIVDRHKLLLTSANFTNLGMDANFEFGIQVEGWIVGELRESIVKLLATDMFEKLL